MMDKNNIIKLWWLIDNQYKLRLSSNKFGKYFNKVEDLVWIKDFLDVVNNNTYDIKRGRFYIDLDYHMFKKIEGLVFSSNNSNMFFDVLTTLINFFSGIISKKNDIIYIHTNKYNLNKVKKLEGLLGLGSINYHINKDNYLVLTISASYIKKIYVEHKLNLGIDLNNDVRETFIKMMQANDDVISFGIVKEMIEGVRNVVIDKGEPMIINEVVKPIVVKKREDKWEAMIDKYGVAPDPEDPLIKTGFHDKWNKLLIAVGGRNPDGTIPKDRTVWEKYKPKYNEERDRILREYGFSSFEDYRKKFLEKDLNVEVTSEEISDLMNKIGVGAGRKEDE